MRYYCFDFFSNYFCFNFFSGKFWNRNVPSGVPYVYIIFNTFVTCDDFSELIRKISPPYIFLVYIPSHHKILVPIGLVAKEI